MQERATRPTGLEAILGAGWLTADNARGVAVRCAALVRRALLSDITSIFLATRLGFLLLTYFGLALFRDPALVGDSRTGFSGYLLDRWFYRDSQWFLTVVRDGYHYYGAGHRSAVAFFPLYPLLVRGLHSITSIEPGICAMLVANAAFLGALIALYKLCLYEYGAPTARRAVLYMAIFPTAFFTFAPYSESLFLALSIASLYNARRQRWWLAGIFGGLAAATRILGVLLVLAFAWEYLRTHQFRPRRFRLDLLAGALIPAGIGAYMTYLYGLTGDPLAFVKAEAGWNRNATWPWQVLTTSLSDIPKTGAHHPYFQAHALIENGLLVGCLLVLLVRIRQVPLSFTIFGLACAAALLSAPVNTSDIPITSMSRYLLALVPVFIVLARWGRWAIFDRLYVLLAAGSLAIFTTLFLNHMWGA